jgi:transposase
MQTKITKKLDFSNQNFYIGLDVHKRSWYVTILTDGLELKTFSQPPSANILAGYLTNNYPNDRYYSAYEAGFCGFSAHRELLNLGIENIVVNPADIPRMDKELTYQTDKTDSRSIARELRNKQLHGIHVFEPSDEEFRALFRYRIAIAKDIRRTCNRIKSFLYYRSISIPAQYDNSNWSKSYINWLEQLPLTYAPARIVLDQLVTNYRQWQQKKLDIERQLRTIAKQVDFELYRILQSIPGIGPLTSIAIISEIKDINRFKYLKHIASYVGFVPRISQSGEKTYTGKMTYRNNNYLRPLLVEAAWQSIRSDPSMLAYYKQACRKSNSKKAIIKVARKLLSRIMFVMKHRVPYQNNMN